MSQRRPEYPKKISKTRKDIVPDICFEAKNNHFDILKDIRGDIKISTEIVLEYQDS